VVLSEIVTALAGNLLGWGGIVLVASVVCATLVWLLHRQLLAEGNELLLSTLLTLLAAAVCATHWLPDRIWRRSSSCSSSRGNYGGSSADVRQRASCWFYCQC